MGEAPAGKVQEGSSFVARSPRTARADGRKVQSGSEASKHEGRGDKGGNGGKSDGRREKGGDGGSGGAQEEGLVVEVEPCHVGMVAQGTCTLLKEELKHVVAKVMPRGFMGPCLLSKVSGWIGDRSGRNSLKLSTQDYSFARYCYSML